MNAMIFSISIDIRAEDHKEESTTKAGKPVETVPQIFVDQQHIGGYTDCCMGERKSGRLIVSKPSR